MNTEAIQFTIRQLREIAANEAFAAHFTLSYWGNQLMTHELDEPEDPGCGFTGCYMGWAIHQQWYAPWGLRLGFVHNIPSGQAEFVDGSGTFSQLPSKLSIFPEVLAESTLAYQQYRPRLPERSDNATGALAAVADVLGLRCETLEKVIYEEAYREQAGPADVADRFGDILVLGESAFMEVQIEREEEWAREDNDV